MKNLIDPQELAILKSKPATCECIVDFLIATQKWTQAIFVRSLVFRPGTFTSGGPGNKNFQLRQPMQAL